MTDNCNKNEHTEIPVSSPALGVGFLMMLVLAFLFLHTHQAKSWRPYLVCSFPHQLLFTPLTQFLANRIRVDE